jgi:hypothetical protein
MHVSYSPYVERWRRKNRNFHEASPNFGLGDSTSLSSLQAAQKEKELIVSDNSLTSSLASSEQGSNGQGQKPTAISCSLLSLSNERH